MLRAGAWRIDGRHEARANRQAYDEGAREEPKGGGAAGAVHRLSLSNLCAYVCHARPRREPSPNTPCSSALRHSSTLPSTEKAMGIS